jgi:V/A-type H+-transporting ATPase subunit I
MGEKVKTHRLYPKPLSIAKVIAPIKYKRNIVKAIEGLGNVEPIHVDPRIGADQMQVEGRRNDFEAFRTKLNGFISSINTDLIPVNGKIIVANDEDEVFKFVQTIVEEKGSIATSIIQRREEITSRINDLDNIIKLLGQMETLDVESNLIADTLHTKTNLGTIFPPQLNRLLWLIDEITQGRHYIQEKEISDKETILLISVLQEDADAVQLKLNSLNFQDITIPKDVDLDGLTPADCEKEIDQLTKENEELQEKLDTFAKENGSSLLAAFEASRIELQRIEVELQMRRTETTCILWAWLPDDGKVSFRTTMHKVTEGSASVDFRKGDFDPEFTPSYVTNSNFMAPMRGLVTSFGTPAMNEVDPYPIVKYLFPILFAIMFADFGHGFILLLLGLYAKRKKDKMVEMPKGISGFFYGGAELLIIMGFTSMLMGIPLNSFFGDETFFWQFEVLRNVFEGTTWKFFFKITEHHDHGHTEYHIERNYVNFLVFSFIVGALVILLGLGLNLYQLRNNRHSDSELYAASTLTGTYVSVIFAAVSGAAGLPGFVMLIFIGLTLFCIGATLEIERRAHGIDGLMLAVDHVLSLLSNTFSFGRLLAMNTIHFVLAFLPYLFLDMAFDGLLNHNIDQWIDSSLYVIWIIAALIGSLIVVPVETTFSTLQSLRLNWVEFFGKFYKGSGIEFKPVRLNRLYTAEKT